jgi:hypothetical protein
MVRITARRVGVPLFAAIVIVGVAAASAFAADSATDPRDTAGRVDFKSVSDRVEGADVVYRVETYNGYDNRNDFYLMRFRFDLHGTGVTGDMCIELDQNGEGGIQAQLYPKCGQIVWATNTAVKPAANVVEFRFPIQTLIYCCNVVPGKPLSYTLWSMDMQGNKDVFPAEGLIQESGLPNPPRRPGERGTYVPNELAGAGIRGGGNAASINTREEGSGNGNSGAHALPKVALIVGGLLLAALVTGGVLFLRGRLVWVDTAAVEDKRRSIDAHSGSLINAEQPNRVPTAPRVDIEAVTNVDEPAKPPIAQASDELAQASAEPNVVAHPSAHFAAPSTPRQTPDFDVEGWPIDSTISPQADDESDGAGRVNTPDT